MSRGCCGDEEVMWGYDQLMFRGKRRGFGGMRREVVDMLRRYFRMSCGCCGG
jgi:hypothetical protein